MLFTEAERDRRWGLTRSLLDQLDLDAVLARGTAASDGQGDYRWLSLYSPLSADGAVVLSTDEQALFAHDGAQAMYAAKTSWFPEPLVAPGIADRLAGWLAAHSTRRLGVAGLAQLPLEWHRMITQSIPGVELVDVGAEMLRARTAKSSEELQIMQQSAHLADEVWELAQGISWRGRREHEVLADLTHHLNAGGCDLNFCLIMHTSREITFDRQPADRRFVEGDAFLLEISPRLWGYYTQLTSVVSLGPPTAELADAFEVGVAARRHAAGALKPGGQGFEVAALIEEYAQENGHRLGGPSFGHFLGLELEEPRIGATEYEFVEDSVLVYHPVIGTEHYPVVLRGDTFRVGADGPVPMNTLEERITEL